MLIREPPRMSVHVKFEGRWRLRGAPVGSLLRSCCFVLDLGWILLDRSWVLLCALSLTSNCGWAGYTPAIATGEL